MKDQFDICYSNAAKNDDRYDEIKKALEYNDEEHVNFEKRMERLETRLQDAQE